MSSEIEYKNHAMTRRIFLKMAGLAATGFIASSCQIPAIENVAKKDGNLMNWWRNTSDYTTQWWANGLHHPELVFNMQTSRFGLSFDVSNFQLRRFGPIAKAITIDEVLTGDNTLVDSLPEVKFEAGVELGGQRCLVTSAGRTYEDCQLIESGRFFQRRWLSFLGFEPLPTDIDWKESGLEVSTWPDRAAFILRLLPKAEMGNTSLEICFTLPETFSELVQQEGGGAYLDQQGQGFIFTRLDPSQVITFDAANQRVIVTQKVENGQVGKDISVGVVVYPVLDGRNELERVASCEFFPLEVRAEQELPTAVPMKCGYSTELGCHTIELRNDGDTTEYDASSNDRVEQVSLIATNPGKSSRLLRLEFSKEGQVFGITGITALLRDLSHNPLGVPVQISKNWHRGAQPGQSQRFEGPWYHGFTMLEVPPGQTIMFEYASVNALWKKIPAASHVQLCLVGWGSNQLWDQAAIGAWGESLCFEPDQAQTGAMVLDTRPLMVWGMGKDPKQKWRWTNNVGGADFLVYYDEDVRRQGNSRMKAHYRRNGPNLTEVTYAGFTADSKIALQITVSLYRSDDITRGIYRFRYDVLEETAYSRLVLFQCGADTYSYTSERKFAYGNAAGLAQEWETQWGGFAYHTPHLMLEGDAPWISMHAAASRDKDAGAWANRGLVVRQWKALLNGKPAPAAFAERGALVHNEPTSLVEFLPPEGEKILKPGDFVEAEIIHLVLPQFAADYYGPNVALTAALTQYENTWKMVHREAAGNHMQVKVTRGGTLERPYPIKIRGKGTEVRFSVTGGVGYVPVTISRLSDYRGWQLEENAGEGWRAISTSHEDGGDWQTDFNSTTGDWELTFSLPLDTPGDQRLTREFKLTQEG
jgi:hypothetical protein